MQIGKVRELIDRALPELVAFRRDLHAHPELGYNEHRTSERICAELSRLGVEHVAGLAGGTGVAAHLPATEGGSDRPAVALRADIDALPIEEATGLGYASVNKGVMHACGHDGHAANLIGVARVLASLHHRPNPVTLLFQPAEEGGAGGRRMCEDGVLDGSVVGPPVGMIYGLHGWPELPLGSVATRPGPLLAATDNFRVSVVGRQSHAAYPHLGHDPIVAAAHCITALQTIPSRSADPTDCVVVTVGTVSGGSAINVIPGEVELAVTVRTLSPDTRAVVRARFFEVLGHTARAHGCEARIGWEEGYPVTFNDAEATERFFAVARGVFGHERVHVVPSPTMGGEDFSFYAERVPACFFVLGMARPGEGPYPSLHRPDFDFNDDALATGVEAMCALALAED